MTNQTSPPPRAPKTHYLKIWPEHYAAIKRGVKTFEVRKDDRGYQVGDTLRLKEWSPSRATFIGGELSAIVTHISAFKQQPGYIVMAIAEVPF